MGCVEVMNPLLAPSPKDSQSAASYLDRLKQRHPQQQQQSEQHQPLSSPRIPKTSDPCRGENLPPSPQSGCSVSPHDDGISVLGPTRVSALLRNNDEETGPQKSSSFRNSLAVEMIRREVLARDKASPGNMRSSKPDRIFPILEEESTGRQPLAEIPVLSPSTGVESVSTESNKTIKWSLMPQSPGANQATTPSYPFPSMNIGTGTSSEISTPALHRPFTALSPTIPPFQDRSSENTVRKGKTPARQNMSSITKGVSSLGNLGVGDPRQDQGPDIYGILLKLQSEPGLEKWWSNVSHIMRTNFAATRMTLAVPSDSTDVENVPWAQMATCSCNSDDQFSSGATRELQSIHSGLTNSSELDEWKSEASPKTQDRSADTSGLNLADTLGSRPPLATRHSFAGFPQRPDSTIAEDRQSNNLNPSRPAMFRTSSNTSRRSELPVERESSQGIKLSLASLEQHIATQDDAASQSANTSGSRERDLRARILPVLQTLEMEPDSLLNSAGAVRVLERGELVCLTREYRDVSASLIHAARIGGGREDRTNWPTPETKASKASTFPMEKMSRSTSSLDTRLVTRSCSHTSGSSKSASGSANTKDEVAERLARAVPYEDYEQISPSPWSQSPAPSPAVQGDPEVNPFFVDISVDEEAFSENPPAHDYTSERRIETIGIDRASSIIHVPLVHPIVSKPKRQSRLKEVGSTKTKKHASELEVSSVARGSYPQASLSSSDDERRTPIAILSLLSSSVPYPSSLSASLNVLAPHLATSLYNARQHSNLEKQLAGVSRRRYLSSGPPERRGSQQYSELAVSDIISPPTTESVTSAGEYSETSLHSPKGSNVGTPLWEYGQGLGDDQLVDKPPSELSAESGDNYFGPKTRYNARRTVSATLAVLMSHGEHSAGAAGVDSSQTTPSKYDQYSNSKIDSRSNPAPPMPKPPRRTMTASALQSGDRATVAQPLGDSLESYTPESQDAASSKRDASPPRRHGDTQDIHRRQARLQASGQAKERSQRSQQQLHSQGADFVATNPSLPAATAKLPPIASKYDVRSVREEDFTFKPPTSSLMRIMIDSGAIQEFIAEPLTGDISWANSRFQTYRNESASQIRRKPWDTIHPKDQKMFRKLWKTALHTGDQISHQARLRRFDGQYRWFHIRIVPIKDSYASIKHWHGQAMDIHDQHIAEVKAAREKEKAASESKYRSLANSNPHIIFAASVPEGMTFANTQWLSYSGQRFDDALGFGFLDHVHPDDIVKCQFPALGRDGGTSSSMSNNHPRGSGSATFENASDHSTATDDTMKGKPGEAPDDETPATVPVLAPSGLLRSLATKGVIKASKDGQGRLSITTEMRLMAESGHYRWHLVQGSFIESVNFGKGEAQWIIACADISDQKHIEKKLKDANTTLESETTRKMQFLSTMSHEIRTPLNGIIGNLQFLLNSDLDDYQSEWTYGADAAARGMHDLINDILDVSKAEAKMLTLYYDWFHVRSIIEDVCETMVSKANEKRLELCYHMESQVPSIVKGDAGRIRQILLNLVSNAVKFTQRGEIYIDCVVHTPPVEEPAASVVSDTITLLFIVQDTGSGFSNEEAKNLFKPYSQLDNNSTRINGGTGLGLLLCKQMVELHHGHIFADSTLGKGSTFKFTAVFQLPTGDDRPKIPHYSSSSDTSASSFTRDKKHVFGRSFVASPGEISLKSETFESSGSSDPSVASSIRASRRSLRSSVSSIDSMSNLASLNLTLPSKQPTIEEVDIPETALPAASEALHPPMYSIIIVCPQEHTRRTTEAHIQQILPKSIPAQLTTSQDVIASHCMMSGEQPINFTHVVLQLNDAARILDFMDLIFNSKHYPQTCIVVITDQAQQAAIMASEPAFDYEDLCSSGRLLFLLKPAKPPKFAKIFDPKEESALSKDHSRANRAEHVVINKQAFRKFEDILGNRGIKVLAVEDNKLNMKARFIVKHGT